MEGPAGVGTLPQETLSSCTAHIIQQERALPFAEFGLTRGCEGSATAQLPAYHVGVVPVPAVVTNPAPLATVEDFHTSRTSARPIHELHLWPAF